jgi:Spy/CpxP family protein refolding chaperone
MTRRVPTMWKLTLKTLPLVIVLAAPAVAQDEAPGPPPEGPPPFVQRLEKFRFERLQKELELTDVQVNELRQEIQEHRESMKQAMTSEREAAQSLRQALENDPVDQDQVRTALERLEARREATHQLQLQQRRRVGQTLSPEQRAKFMLFNQRFDRRLRELIDRRRGGGPRGGGPRMMRGPGRGGRFGVPGIQSRAPGRFRGIPGERAGGAGFPQRIEQLEKRIAELESNRN